jgi:type VI secretion system protein ImpB
MAANKSIQEFIERNRPPRVQIGYKVDATGEAKVELPLHIGVMANLSGERSEKPVDERPFVEIDVDNFDSVMKKSNARVKTQVANKVDPKAGPLSVDLLFQKLKDFTPAEIARQVPELKPILDAVTALRELKTTAEGKKKAEAILNELLGKAVRDPAVRERLGLPAAPTT